MVDDDINADAKIDAEIKSEEDQSNNEDEDNDPMLAGLKEAEAEIAAEAEKAEKEKAETEEKSEEPAGEKKEGSDNKDLIQIPKPRLDEVLSQRDAARDQVIYLKGIVDTQSQLIAAKGNENPEAEKTGEKKEPEISYEDQIKAQEQKKLEIADKYEEGEITFKEMQQSLIDADREIRTITEKHYQSISDQTKQEAAKTVEDYNAQNYVRAEALRIQENNPYIAEIDKLPSGIRDGIWLEVTNEAVKSLAAKGGNPNDLLALMREKAELINTNYGPRYIGDLKKGEEKPENKGLSEEAKRRSEKIDLSNKQPPSMAGSGKGDVQQNLTEDDLLNMSDDQIADLYDHAPGLMKKITGL